MIRINNVDMPTPSGYTVGIMDITNAERNSKGTMFIDLIATKRKLELEWRVLAQEDMTKVLNVLESSITFSVTYIDPKTGTNKTGMFYKGDRSIPMLDFLDGKARWENFKVNLIEV